MIVTVTGIFGVHWNHGAHMDGGWMWLWGIVVVVTLVAAMTAVLALANGSRATVVRSDDGARRALAIAMERYTRGEITLAEYEEMSARLR